MSLACPGLLPKSTAPLPTDGNVAQAIFNNFYDPAGPHLYHQAGCVACWESGWDPLAENPTTLARGLFQIHPVHWAGLVRDGVIQSSDQLWEPYFNALAAKVIYQRAGNSWSPWEVFTDGCCADAPNYTNACCARTTPPQWGCPPPPPPVCPPCPHNPMAGCPDCQQPPGCPLTPPCAIGYTLDASGSRCVPCPPPGLPIDLIGAGLLIGVVFVLTNTGGLRR